ncbi:hypothetical protein WG622_08435 [Cognatishimia sp. D5M38]|uniref:Uncharacterized protein n=1 Tax=Cognatishimia coralii TaxID=3083254 RepID=A0ABU8QFS9_9RHOB
MANNYVKSLLIGSVCLYLGFSSPVWAQQSAVDDADSFTSENAILDTSILFAIGAREARQELRGSFGWPTFQEGLVEGVYFRFDPDGYARFSPSPRLDTDVFEVICRPRTYTCMGRKNGLAVALTSRGSLQLRMENVLETDQFFVSDGVSELPLPQNILQPLDPRLELLLSSGGELVVKRREAEAEQVSLVGFAAVAAYLRWISARQDYVVLPRGWPVPNSDTAVVAIGLTQAASWQSPMPQPLIPQAVQQGLDPSNQSQITEIAETSKEAFELLKEIADPRPVRLAPNSSAPQAETLLLLTELKMSIDTLASQLHSFAFCSAPKSAEVATSMLMPDHQKTVSNEITMDAVGMGAQGDASLAKRLEFLIEEIGLPADLALIVAQQGKVSELDVAEDQSNVVGEILSELRAQLKSENTSESNEVESSDYKLLSEYFKSVKQ